MKYEPILSQAIRVDLESGFPEGIDRLAEQVGREQAFLRAAWYRAGADNDGKTLIARRRDGAVVAAIPLTRIGPQVVGAKGVPGSYWPFRAPLIGDGVTSEDLVALLADPVATDALAPMWRIGPIPADTPSTRMLREAAARAGWTVLERNLGTTWRFDLAAAARDNGGSWPRKSSRKRLNGYLRRLADTGTVNWRAVSGADWTPEVLDQLGRVEADSWVARKTDGSGAKFLDPHQRARWQTVLADPVLAEALSATLLLHADRPVAFSFDLRAGTTQFAIAGSYAEDMAEYRVGKIVTYRQLEGALAAGVELVDLGSGDSGYKREMGAGPGPALIDLLIVRQREAALVLKQKWGQEPPELRRLTLASPYRSDLPLPSLRHLAAAAAMAGTAVAITE